MSENKVNRINGRDVVIGLLTILFSIFIVFLFPFAAPVVGVVLLVGGTYTYRQDIDQTTRTIAITVMAAGAMILLTSVLIMIFLISTNIGSGDIVP
ncbi:MAG: hypothetical protein C5S46_06440 [Candidatus Methanomarinus sp.]|uniref:Uncharacterized protein n=1 Tax=Candidatus Methanomarinus sp. TaxID=3386244 RepID=A0AC61SA12_9EURY|nr:hypothetical protein C5S42_02175 [ANME-2 cluster archaeon]TKY91327.1 MAG: hypothetical protein C5S46_06440 [ANME-2 cluster archaeon]